MRVSTYEIVVPLPSECRFLLLHGIRGTADVVSMRIGEVLLNADGAQVLSSDLQSADLTYLLSRGHLTIATEDQELQEARKHGAQCECVHARRDSSRSFVFILTYSCNLRCTYCYQQPFRSDVTMEPWRLRQCLSIVEKSQQNSSEAIEIFGGEPLSTETEPLIQILLTAVNRPRRLIATTNGYALVDYARYLGPEGISDIIVTLDGPKDVHDSRRRSLTGDSSFERIVAGIDTALRRNAQVRLRINLDANNLAALPRLADDLDGRGWFSLSNFCCYYALTKSFPGQRSHYGLLTTQQVLSFLEAEEVCHPGLVHIGERAGDLLRPFLDGRLATTQTRACGAVGSSIFFSPDGLLYNCQEAAGQPDYAIGTYDDELHLDENRVSRWQARRMPGIEGCVRCPFVFLCAGGCAFRAFAEGKDKQPYCEAFPNDFIASVQREWRLRQARSSALEARGFAPGEPGLRA